MARKKPNALQKLVRSTLRELIDRANSQKPSRKTKKQKTASNFEKAPTKTKKKRSRYISKSVRVTVLNRDKYKCVFCGRSSQQIELQIDHITPFSKGGLNDINNLQTLCIDCNLGKSDRIL